MGNVIRTSEHQAHFNADADSYEDVVMTYEFDIKGQLVESIDPFNRVISANKYNTAGQMLKTTHIDRGAQTLLVDALNLPFVTNDAKGAQSLFAYDNLQRPTFVWARDNANEQISKRQIMQYGDSAGISNPQNQNLKGKLYIHYDEAGLLVYESYDFKGNNLSFFRQALGDGVLTAYQKFVVNWDALNNSDLSNTRNYIDQEYDGLNRIRKAVYPEDVNAQRKEMIPKYNKGGALRSLKVDSQDYIKEVGYNARGQRIILVMGNHVMTRYAYDPLTFRVLRQRSAFYLQNGLTYTPNAGIRQDLQYTYDLEGTIKTINDAAPANTYAQGPGDLLRRFTHDPLRRLLSATGRENSNLYSQPSWDLNIRPQDYTTTNTYTRSYQYDKIGNIQKLTHLADGHANQNFSRDYAYDSSDNKLKSFTVNSTTYGNTYDPNGSLTKEGKSRYYEWGANDKLAVFKNQAGSSTPSVYTNYFYNAQGERIKKHTRKGNKVVVTFYMDGGMFETTYTKTVGGSIDNNRFYNTIKVSDDGALIATIRVGKNVDDHTPDIQYIVGDHLNNSTSVVKTTGGLINREEYYPFGETSYGSFQYKRYRYNGKEKDEESGLYEYGQRYYAPWVCRFVSVDPIAEDYPQLSSYNYAGNKPITSSDIDGLQSEVDTPFKNSTQGQSNTKANNDGLLNIEVHQVKQGESISGLSREYGVSEDALRDANPQTQKRSQADQINIGENIIVPFEILQNQSGLEKYNSRDAEGLEHIPFISEYQKNIEKQTESVESPPQKDFSLGDLASDLWNSPIARVFVPDKVKFSLSASVTAVIGFHTGVDVNWITRGNDASFAPYPTFAVGSQIGPKASASALVGICGGYFLVSDVRQLKEYEAANLLLGFDASLSGEVGALAGGEGSISVGFDSEGIQTLDYGIGGGFSIGGGLSGGVNYTIPIIPSQYKK